MFQRYSVFSSKVFLLLYFHHRETGNTKREFDAKKTVNVSDIHLTFEGDLQTSAVVCKDFGPNLSCGSRGWTCAAGRRGCNLHWIQKMSCSNQRV